MQEGADPNVAPSDIVPLRQIPKELVPQATVRGVDVTEIGERDDNQVSACDFGVRRETADQGDGSEQEKDIPQLQSDGQRLAREDVAGQAGVGHLVGVVLVWMLQDDEIAPHSVRATMGNSCIGQSRTA